MIWGLANPKIGEREVTRALLEHDHHLVRVGQVILGGKGFAGREFEDFVTGDLEAHLIRPDRKDKKPRSGKFGGIRQWIARSTHSPQLPTADLEETSQKC